MFIISTFIAEVISVAIKTPFEVVKQNRQYKEFGTTFSAVKEIWNQRGVRGFYAGYFATLLRETIYGVIEMGIYEYLYINYRYDYVFILSFHQKIEWVHALACGLISGGLSGFITTPLDVIKTRMMTNTVKDHTKNMFNWAKQIWLEEGLPSFFKGGFLRTLLMGIGGAIFFTFYNLGLRSIGALEIYHEIRK